MSLRTYLSIRRRSSVFNKASAATASKMSAQSPDSQRNQILLEKVQMSKEKSQKFERLSCDWESISMQPSGTERN